MSSEALVRSNKSGRPETNFKSENLNEKGFSFTNLHQCVCSLSRENHHHNIVVDREGAINKILGRGGQDAGAPLVGRKW